MFGEWIKSRRLELGLNANECAARAGMTESVWSRYETGESRSSTGKPTQPREKAMSGIAKALEVPLAVVVAKAYPAEDGVEHGNPLVAYIETKEAEIPPGKRPRYRQLAMRQLDALAEAMTTA